jgi:cytochrome b
MGNETVRVWDIAVRVFHWSLVASFAIAYLTGEEDSPLHIYSGYAVLGLVLFRVVWGFVGTRYARFSDFLHGPSSVVSYLKGLVSGNPRRFIGHTPAGGWMILLLLASLAATSLTGLKVYGLEGQGPLAGEPGIVPVATAHADEDGTYGREEHDDEDDAENESAEELWEELHEFLANFTLLLIFVHVAAVVITGRLHKENLVKAMVSGQKKA